MNFIGCESTYEQSETVLFGVPYDGTVSYRPGTRFAPPAIRLESDGIETYSPYLNCDLLDRKIHDAGDLILPFGNREFVFKEIEEKISILLKDGKKPCTIGGEHLITYPVIRQMLKKYPDLHILHFDAHADLRDDYLGEKLSHATVMRRVWDLTGDDRIYQFGIRSGERSEFEWAEKHVNMQKYSSEGLDEVLKKLEGKPLYVTVDLDVLDPSCFPGTGTPEPGGWRYQELLKVLLLLKNKDIVGADMVELSPHYDASGISTITACKTLRELLLVL
ncbi:MAG TPA: agmatinase [Eubacteriaceae bacterium]|nr:agmatinase [Eubacteriaceae bacterium]